MSTIKPGGVLHLEYFTRYSTSITAALSHPVASPLALHAVQPHHRFGLIDMKDEFTNFDSHYYRTYLFCLRGSITWPEGLQSCIKEYKTWTKSLILELNCLKSSQEKECVRQHTLLRSYFTFLLFSLSASCPDSNTEQSTQSSRQPR